MDGAACVEGSAYGFGRIAVSCLCGIDSGVGLLNIPSGAPANVPGLIPGCIGGRP